jgi:hypothetical protein
MSDRTYPPGYVFRVIVVFFAILLSCVVLAAFVLVREFGISYQTLSVHELLVSTSNSNGDTPADHASEAWDTHDAESGRQGKTFIVNRCQIELYAEPFYLPHARANRDEIWVTLKICNGGATDCAIGTIDFFWIKDGRGPLSTAIPPRDGYIHPRFFEGASVPESDSVGRVEVTSELTTQPTQNLNDGTHKPFLIAPATTATVFVRFAVRRVPQSSVLYFSILDTTDGSRNFVCVVLRGE